VATKSWRGKSAVFRMYSLLTSHGYSKSMYHPLSLNGYIKIINAVKRQRNLGLTAEESRTKSQRDYKELSPIKWTTMFKQYTEMCCYWSLIDFIQLFDSLKLSYFLSGSLFILNFVSLFPNLIFDFSRSNLWTLFKRTVSCERDKKKMQKIQRMRVLLLNIS
jgi:hypothetical protein